MKIEILTEGTVATILVDGEKTVTVQTPMQVEWLHQHLSHFAPGLTHHHPVPDYFPPTVAKPRMKPKLRYESSPSFEELFGK